MDSYRSKIKRKMFFGGVICSLSVVIAILDQLGVIDKISFIKKYEMISDFQFGFLVGIGLVAAVMMFKLGNALKDETKLKMLYNEEHDERIGLIRQKSGMPMLVITSCIMIFVGIIAGYVNEVVFVTLVAAATIQIIFSVLIKMYYMKKI
ncbi:hypothetical protein SAMN02745136_03590 [Anaerocolumna jejuensis DSM 15929]|uniref:Uncharacterized protein n=1 Tax=Anaerocolumna jejuensis DSM 15929 TaxID=1121322 RepID=A0A1M6W5B9_9FIRM|nr:hypothetical protein [Anaerocolumna jejuensis]SHK88954.1 hypothetical protein SAMN02745136_03590 [Anaerocolumna jejuensis DSM 15929]